MPNAWDGVSSLLIKKSGFKAIETSAAAFSFSLGVPDGVGAVSRSEEIDNAVTIGTLTGLPVNGDFENGFGPSPEDCVATVEAAIEAGIAGLTIDDTTNDRHNPIHDFDHAVKRIAAAAAAAKGRILLTGKTSNFLHGYVDPDETIRRLVAFADVGADVLFAPFPPDIETIRRIVKAVSPKPVNVCAGAFDPIALEDLLDAGVKRVSLGSTLYCHVMAKLEEACEMLAQGDLIAATGGIWPGKIAGMIREATA